MNLVKFRIGLLSVALVVLLITVISFVVLKRTPSGLEDATRPDKAELIYKRAESFLKADEHDKALNALFVIINKYPDSRYAEKSLKALGATYLNKGDYSKAGYYYQRLLRDFPGAKDAPAIRAAQEEINMKQLLSPAITEDSVEYVVLPGDSLYAISKRFNTTIDLLKKVNNIQGDIIRPNQKLKVVVARFSVLVDKSRNVLMLEKDGELVKTYTVSTGKGGSTPVGTFKIEEKLVRPLWYKVGAVVSPDSEEYELGARWMGLSAEGYGIHGTADESTIGNQITQGCVRMRNGDVVELYGIVPRGTEVKIVNSVEVPGEKTKTE